MENIKAFENFDDVIDETYIDDDFPVKNHNSAARRKKAYFKGKRRYNLALQKGFVPDAKDRSILRGMMRKTCVINPYIWKCATCFTTNRGTVRRDWSANDKMNEYVTEV